MTYFFAPKRLASAIASSVNSLYLSDHIILLGLNFLTRFRRQAKRSCRPHKTESIRIYESEQSQTKFLDKPKNFEIGAGCKYSKDQ